MLSWLVLQCCWSRRGPLWCVHPGTWCCSLSPRSHHWWSEEHAESALSWSQQQSPSSSPHQREIVVTAPPGQAAHLAPVVCLISVADETHHSRLHKFNEEVGVVWRCAVVGQQSEEEGLSTHPWGGPLCSVWWCWMCYCRPVLPEVSRSESPTASCTAMYWAPDGPVYEWAVEGWLCWMLNWSLWTAIWHTCPFCPDVLRAGWRAVAMASSVERLDLYANWKGSREGGRTDLMCCMTKPFKALHENRSECYWTVVIEAGWRWLLRDWNDGGSFEACGDNSLT